MKALYQVVSSKARVAPVEFDRPVCTTCTDGGHTAVGMWEQLPTGVLSAIFQILGQAAADDKSKARSAHTGVIILALPVQPSCKLTLYIYIEAMPIASTPHPCTTKVVASNWQ